MSAASKIVSARTTLVLEQPFFGSLALSLKVKADPGCGTAYTDGRVLGYDPAFIESLSHARITGTVAHEVFHCALGHPWRRDGREFKRWNIACDLAINPQLRDSGFTLPDGVLYPSLYSLPDGKSAEWYYSRIPESKSPDPQPGKGKEKGNGTPQPGNGQPQPGTPDPNAQPDPNGKGTPDPLGEVRDAPTGPDADGDPAPTEQDWKLKASQALNSAKMAGKLAGGLSRTIGEALKPRIDVRSLLLRFFSERSTGDYSCQRPNPRYIAQGLYLPALESKALGEIIILADTSGSMDTQALAFTRGIVEQVIEETNPAGVTLYMVDTEVHTVHRMERGEPLTWEPKGGGGTDFSSFFEQVASGEVQPVCIIGITDLQARFGDLIPDVPVLWLTTENRTAPFGEVVFVDR